MPVERLAHEVLADAVRDLIDSVVAADLPEHDLDEVVNQIEQLTRSFEEQQPPGGPIDIRLPGAPAYARIGRVPWVSISMAGGELTGRARFRLIHAGSTGAAHGGAVAFLMDEVMGVLANGEADGVARTATISVDFKQTTPVDIDLAVKATQQSLDGRKQWVAATLKGPNGVVLATAKALFITVAR